MSDLPQYRRSYKDPRVRKAYHLYVDSKASLKTAAEVTGTSKRTLERWSSPSKDAWEAERVERAQASASVAAVAAVTASAPTVDGAEDLETKLSQALTSTDTLARFGAVLTAQRTFFDELMTDVRELLATTKDKAKATGRPVQVGQLMVIASLGKEIATQQRKAHGIPDVTKLELDDTRDGTRGQRGMSDEELRRELEQIEAAEAAAKTRAAAAGGVN